MLVPNLTRDRGPHARLLRYTRATRLLTDDVMGILTEGVNETLGLTASEILAAPSFGSGVKAEYLSGMGRVDERFIPILDLGCLLSFEAIGSVERSTVAIDEGESASGTERNPTSEGTVSLE